MGQSRKGEHTAWIHLHGLALRPTGIDQWHKPDAERLSVLEPVQCQFGSA